VTALRADGAVPAGRMAAHQLATPTVFSERLRPRQDKWEPGRMTRQNILAFGLIYPGAALVLVAVS